MPFSASSNKRMPSLQLASASATPNIRVAPSPRLFNGKGLGWSKAYHDTPATRLSNHSGTVDPVAEDQSQGVKGERFVIR